MTASLPRRKQPRVTISAHEPTDFPSGEQQALIQGALLRECDETLVRLLEFSRHSTTSPVARTPRSRDHRISVEDLRNIEQMLGQIVATVPQNEDEMMGKAAVYREYANFSDRQPDLMTTMLQAASRELERGVLQLKKHSTREN
ncbi:hypothetical protein A1351_22335 [Methylosinus sp. R-45379]|uniref:hypothetical protein n=1 Tax=Methylosinus sp. R-45379 TaxID=980563 RepID=UPI0007D7B5F7|nr:hypothetical protein [Methylosinus sp. R-45379]OAI30932.1 hypothetical protein A1351_22335 [Methylosinus sp. R-45379]